MNLKLRSMLCLLSMSVLFTDGATAQSGDPLAAMDARTKFASGYAGCVKYARENSTPSLISVRLGEQGPALISVNINAKGHLTQCTVVKGTGSERLDGASCDWVKDHWHLLERCQNSRLQQISQPGGKP